MMISGLLFLGHPVYSVAGFGFYPPGFIPNYLVKNGLPFGGGLRRQRRDRQAGGSLEAPSMEGRSQFTPIWGTGADKSLLLLTQIMMT